MIQRSSLLCAGALGGALVLAVAAAAPAAAPQGAAYKYEVTITNLTPGQVISPVLVATHDGSTMMFRGGTQASSELALLAEDGDNSMLFGALSADAHVHDVQSAAGGLPPGMTETITVEATADARYLSLAGMLVTTNDSFLGVDSYRLPRDGGQPFLAYAYDAGSEANSEKCMYIPGPPCGSALSHDPSPAEGFVAISSGIHGVGDLSAAAYDWNGPVARIAIQRL